MRLGDYSGPWRVSAEPALDGYQVEWAEPGELILSRRNQLFRTRGPGEPLTSLGSFPAPAWKCQAARLRPLQRLLRFLFYNVIKLPDGRLFTSFDTGIGVLEGGRFTPIGGLERPCRILRSACTLAEDGNVYFGEYVANPERGPIHLYRYVPGRPRVDLIHTFPAGGVRHVHGIYLDPYSGRLWCVTGDVGGECRILHSGDGFQTFETQGEGDESWRTVSLAFTESAVYFATDAQFIPNVIYRLERATGERETLGRIDGPVYVCRAIGSEIFFAVTAELCPSQVGRSATLWHVDERGKVSSLVSFPKDRLHVDYFMMGTLHLPLGPGERHRLFLHGVGLQGADNRTFVVERSPR